MRRTGELLRELTDVEQARRSRGRHDQVRVELRRGGDGERGAHHVVGRAYGADVAREPRMLVLRGGKENVVGRRGGEGGRVQRIVSHVGQVELCTGHVGRAKARGRRRVVRMHEKHAAAVHRSPDGRNCRRGEFFQRFSANQSQLQSTDHGAVVRLG